MPTNSKEYMRQWRKDHREEINAKRRGNRAEESKKYYESHKEQITEYNRSEERKARQREKYQENKEQELERQRKYREENPEKVRVSKRNWARKARKTNQQFRLKGNLRNRINKALGRISKTSSTFELIGCDIVTFMTYLEERFLPGMTWENHGEWHIDHIKPCCSFDLTDPSQQKECFHYTNCQPLWAIDNLIKGGYDVPQLD